MAELNIKAANIWRTVKGAKINLSGSWKDIMNSWMKVDDIWRATRLKPWNSQVMYLPVSEGVPTCTPPFSVGQAGTLYCRVTLPHAYADGNHGEFKEIYLETARVRDGNGYTTGGHINLDMYFNHRSDMESLEDALKTNKLTLHLHNGAPDKNPNKSYIIPMINPQFTKTETGGVYKLRCHLPDNGDDNLYGALDPFMRYVSGWGGPVGKGIYVELRKQ